jgi:hypothetical protein
MVFENTEGANKEVLKEGSINFADVMNDKGDRGVAAEGQTNIQGQVSSLKGATEGRPEFAKLFNEGTTVDQVQNYMAAKQAELDSHSAQTGLS